MELGYIILTSKNIIFLIANSTGQQSLLQLIQMFSQESCETHQRISCMKASSTHFWNFFLTSTADGSAVAFWIMAIKKQGRLPVAWWSVIQRAVRCLCFVIQYYRAFLQCKSQQVFTYYYNSNSSTANILLSTSKNHTKLTERWKEGIELMRSLGDLITE